ncbi:hypothetical protein BJ912DRAFT_1143357, partial [Pholiota molesta]
MSPSRRRLRAPKRTPSLRRPSIPVPHPPPTPSTTTPQRYPRLALSLPISSPPQHVPLRHPLPHLHLPRRTNTRITPRSIPRASSLLATHLPQNLPEAPNSPFSTSMTPLRMLINLHLPHTTRIVIRVLLQVIRGLYNNRLAHSSIFGQPRLPTPPPPPIPQRANTTAACFTVKTPSEPALLHFERSLLLAREAEALAESQRRLHPSDDENVYADEEEEEEELKEGSIISLPPTAAVTPPMRAIPLPISPLALAFTLNPDPPPPPPPPGLQDRGISTPTPMGEPSGPSMSGRLSHDSPVTAVFPPHRHLQSGSHSHARPISLPPPLLLPSPSIPRSPSTLALSLSTSSSSSSISAPYTQSPTSSLPSTATPAPQLRLLRPLGMKSVRDLRRKASGRERDGTEKERERDVMRRGKGERKERARRVRDRETATPEPILTPRNELDQSAAALDDTPRPPAARPSASILGHAAPVPSPTPLPTPPPFALSAPPNKSPQRQSSRLREGLRNMLAFSRGAGAACGHGHRCVARLADIPRLEHPLRGSAGPVSLSRTSSVSVRLVGDSQRTRTQRALLRDASLRKFRARCAGRARPAARFRTGGGEDEEDTDGEDGVLRASLTRKPSGVYGGASAAKAVGRLVAVKMTARRAPRTAAASASTAYVEVVAGGEGEERTRVLERQRRREEEERTRVRFVREVEVLKV